MNNKPISILVVGAGGIASYAMPVMGRMFKLKGFILDGDTLEDRNLERQDFDRKTVGKNKAQALIDSHPSLRQHRSLTAIGDYFFPGNQTIAQEADIILCFADNRTAKAFCLGTADMYGKPCIIAGNEYLDNEAWFYEPYMQGHIGDPRQRFPQICDFDEPDLDDPVSCSSEAAQTRHPQLAIANMGAAHKALHLFWLWSQGEIDVGDNTVLHEMHQSKYQANNLLKL